MKPLNPGYQNGIALLIFVVMLMGIGGFLLAGYSQGILKEVEVKKFEHNDRVLKEAKQALLQFAYNYPVTNGNGPGRLPCPDTTNNGNPNAPVNCSTFLGRLPWNQQNLNLYDIRDADGQRLWYAVSNNFSTQEAAGLNSDDFGTITVRDQSGNVIYDGSHPGDVAKSGVAAVIIAPGAITSRNGITQNRSIANADDPFDTTADTDPGIILASNYLDRVVGTEDNATLTQDGAADGFILGPVNEGSLNAVNDQMIVITAAEVIEMAEKATLQTYQTAINDYRARPGFDVFPWLDDYATTPTPTTVYDADVGTRLGRLPSIFSNYFDGTASASIQSEINLSILYDGVGWNETIAIVDVNFDGVGNLVTTSSHSPGVQTFYLWDGHATTPHVLSPQDGVWELCTGTASTGTGNPEDDCNRKTDGTFKIPTDALPAESDVWLEVKIITIDFNQPATPLTFNDADLKGSLLNYNPPTAATHAYVSADYNNGSGLLLLTNDIDHDFKSSFSDQDNGPAFGAADRIRVGIRYYPELPDWPLAAQDNWHDSIQMAYSSGYQPGAASSCTAGTDCITVNNVAGIQDDKIAVLVLASEHDLAGDNDNEVPIPSAPGYLDELDDIFDAENDNGDDIFDARPNNGTGNDKILLIR